MELEGKINKGYQNDDLTADDEKEKVERAAVEGTKVDLQKSIGLFSGTCIIVGLMIGSGIFVSPTGIVKHAQSVGLSIVMWLVCGLISLLGALCYAELGTQIQESGCEYTYLHYAFVNENQSSKKAKLSSIPAFLFHWVAMFILKTSSAAIISLAFGKYFLTMFKDSSKYEEFHLDKLLAILLMILLTIVNSVSVKIATYVQNVTTIIKIVAVAIIIITGFVLLGQGKTEILQTGFTNSTSNGWKLSLALYNGMWAYDGWNNLNFVTGEIINPERNLPLAIFIAIPLVTIVYVLISISYFTLLTPMEIMSSNTAAADWAANIFTSKFSWVMPLFICVSTMGACNGSMFSAARLPYAGAKNGHMISLLGMVHIKWLTPLPAVIFQSTISCIMVIPSNLSDMIDFFNFCAWMFYGLTFFSIIWMRYTKPDDIRPFKVPIILPIIGVMISVYLIIAPIVYEPKIGYLVAFIIMISGLLLYVPFVLYEMRMPYMDKITYVLQIFLNVSAPTS
ncbi:hypothetical protein SNEBB_004413 [Seison nebaliae]|nr:hypothetical protein SNEBB_004413 [Seison nebaliae]